MEVSVDGTEGLTGQEIGLLGVSLIPTNASTVQEVIGWQMTGAESIEGGADEIWTWDTERADYNRAWLQDSGGVYPAYDGLWFDLSTGAVSSMDMSLGTSFWARNKQASPRFIRQNGLVNEQDVEYLVYPTQTAGGYALHMFGYGFVVGMGLNDPRIDALADGAQGGVLSSLADEIWLWSQADDVYVPAAWLYDDGSGATNPLNGVWLDYFTEDPSDAILGPGTGWWYLSKRAATPSPGEAQWQWTIPCPY